MAVCAAFYFTYKTSSEQCNYSANDDRGVLLICILAMDSLVLSLRCTQHNSMALSVSLTCNSVQRSICAARYVGTATRVLVERFVRFLSRYGNAYCGICWIFCEASFLLAHLPRVCLVLLWAPKPLLTNALAPVRIKNVHNMKQIYAP